MYKGVFPDESVVEEVMMLVASGLMLHAVRAKTKTNYVECRRNVGRQFASRAPGN